MHAAAPMALVRQQLNSFERNRYYYGKMLDAYHFDLETAYHNQKRWLINRAVLGYGVVCGLDIKLKDAYTIELLPGLAIDKWGREIVVPEARKVTIDPAVVARAFEQQTTKRHYEVGEKRTDNKHEEELTACVQVMLCYHECLTDPMPVLAGDCHTAEPCVPGTVRESYTVTFTEDCTHPHHGDFVGTQIHARLAQEALDHHVNQALVEIVAAEEPDIGCWSVAPGVVDTDMQAFIRTHDAEAFPAIERIHELHRTGAWNAPAWIADQIVALHTGELVPDAVVYRVPAEPR